MHWECVPGCGRSKVESALHCGGQAEYLHDLTHNRCSAVIAAILVILIRMLFNVEKQSWLYLRMYILTPKQSIVSIITHILFFNISIYRRPFFSKWQSGQRDPAVICEQNG